MVVVGHGWLLGRFWQGVEEMPDSLSAPSVILRLLPTDMTPLNWSITGGGLTPLMGHHKVSVKLLLSSLA